LLSEGEDFNGRIGSTPKEDTDCDEDGKDGFEHELTLLTCRNVASPDERRENRKWLISSPPRPFVYTQVEGSKYGGSWSVRTHKPGDAA
jgi:hypothetical protein